MWIKTENDRPVMPPTVEHSGDRVILNRNFHLAAETEDRPAHYEYETWDMSREQYEVYQYMEQQANEQADAIIELAGIIADMEV